MLTIEKIRNDQYKLTGTDKEKTWHGTGFFDGRIYWGVWYYESNNGKMAVYGTHKATLQKNGTFIALLSFAGKPFGSEYVWSKQKR